jgi:hypothetical protein
MATKGFFMAIIFFLKINHLLGQGVSTIDLVKANANYEKEVMFFYEANWKEFRKLALKNGIISGYELHKTATDSTNHFRIILITKYKDSIQLAQSENNFRPIMRLVSPNGPKLLNNIQRKEFLEYLLGYEAIIIASDEKKKKRNIK